MNDAMKRRVNRLIAENVFGWTVNKEHSPYRWNIPPESELYQSWDGTLADEAYPFCGSWAGLGMVVEEMATRGWASDLHTPDNETGERKASFFRWNPDSGGRWQTKSVVAQTQPEAVALCALRALGVAVEVGEGKA